jgi:hypothetical protein
MCCSIKIEHFDTSPKLNTTWASMTNINKPTSMDTASMVQTGVNSTNSPLDIKPVNTNSFFNNFAGNNRLVNFKCKIKDSEYYLVNVKASDCKNLDALPRECSDSIFILMDAKDVNEKLIEYQKTLANESELCEVKKKQDKSNIDCTPKRMFINDFIVLPIKDKPNKFYIKGTAEPKKGGNSYPTILNSFLYNEFGKSTLCGDDNIATLYPKKQYYIEISVTEKQTNAVNLVTIKFETQNFIEGKDKSGNPVPVPLYDSNGNPKLRSSYVGICTDKKCNYNGKDYFRICLYNDPTSINVLDFEPILVR